MGSLDDFQSGVVEVKTLGVLADLKFPGAPDPDSTHVNAVRRSAVVLLISHVESFLKGLAEDFIDAIDTGAFVARDIPLSLREFHSVPRLHEIVSTSDDAQRRVLLGKLQGIATLWNSGALVPKGSLNAQRFTREVTSASPDKIDRLFSLMGVTRSVCDGMIDYEDADGDVVGLNIRNGLRDVVTLRNEIAHGGAARVPTALDLDRYVRFLSALASRLDREMKAAVANIATAAASRAAASA